MTPTEQQICDTLTAAIKGHNLVQFKYKGTNRIVEPFLIGELYSIHQVDSEEGTFALRAWFMRGFTSQPVDRTQSDRWRIYEFKEMVDLVILDETYKIVRPLYNQDDRKFKRINYRVVSKQSAGL